MVINHPDQQPPLCRDGRPAVCIPSELGELGVLSPVVLHGHPVLGIGEIQTGDEGALFVAKIRVQLGLGQARPHEDETHNRLPRRFRACSDKGQRFAQTTRTASAGALDSLFQVTEVGQLPREDGIAGGDEIIHAEQRAELRPGLRRGGRGQPVSECEVLDRQVEAVPPHSAGPRFSGRWEGRNMQVDRAVRGQREAPQARRGGVAEELCGGQARLVRTTPCENVIRRKRRTSADSMERGVQVSGGEPITGHAQASRLAHGERGTQFLREGRPLHTSTTVQRRRPWCRVPRLLWTDRTTIALGRSRTRWPASRPVPPSRPIDRPEHPDT